jgi:chorismate mutase
MIMMCRGVRGATTADSNTSDAILSATREMFDHMVKANDVEQGAIAGLFLTTSPDLDAEFPALAIRQMGWTSVPLLCAHEINVPRGLHKCIRALLLINTTKQLDQITHVYLRGAVSLREHGMTG